MKCWQDIENPTIACYYCFLVMSDYHFFFKYPLSAYCHISALLLPLQVIEMVSHSSEFENIVVRDEEQNELETLVQTLCPVEVKGGPSNKHGKISILIQACILVNISVDGFYWFQSRTNYDTWQLIPLFSNFQLYISRGWIDTFSLVSDAAYISASLARIMRALFETCLRRGWCEMSLFMLEYCKAVDRQIWPHQHPLRQFDKELPAEVCQTIYYLQ